MENPRLTALQGFGIQPIMPQGQEFIDPGRDFLDDQSISTLAQIQVAEDEQRRSRNRDRRGMALEALSRALATYASADPGRTAAQFIERQMDIRQRNREADEQKARLAMQLNAQKANLTTSIEAEDRRQVRGHEFQGGESQKDRDARKENLDAGFEHDVELEGMREDHALGMQDRQFLHDKGIQRERMQWQSRENGYNRRDARDNAAFAARIEIYNDMESYAAAAGMDPTDAMKVATETVNYLADGTPMSPRAAEMKNQMYDTMAEQRDMAIAGQYAGILSTVAEMSMTTDLSGVTRIDPELYNAKIKALGLPAALGNSNAVAMARIEALTEVVKDRPATTEEIAELNYQLGVMGASEAVRADALAQFGKGNEKGVALVAGGDTSITEKLSTPIQGADNLQGAASTFDRWYRGKQKDTYEWFATRGDGTRTSGQF